jgi:hypothetical protein
LLQADYFRDPNGGNQKSRAVLLEQQANTLLSAEIRKTLEAGGSNSNERASMQAALLEDLRQLHIEKATITNNGDLSVDEKQKQISNIDKQIKGLNQQMLIMTSISNNHSAYESENAQMEKLKMLGDVDENGEHNEMVSEITMDNVWQRFYAEMTGIWTEAEGEELHKMLEDWLNNLGDSEAEQQAILRQLTLSLREQKSQFNTHIPTFEEKIDKKTGRIIYALPSAEELKKENFRGKQYQGIMNWYKTNDIDVSKANSAAADRTKDGKIKSVNVEQAFLNAEMIAGKNQTTISNLKNGAWGDLENLKDSADKELAKESILLQLKAFAHKSKDRSAFDATVSKMQEVLDKFEINKINWSHI